MTVLKTEHLETSPGRSRFTEDTLVEGHVLVVPQPPTSTILHLSGSAGHTASPRRPARRGSKSFWLADCSWGRLVGLVLLMRFASLFVASSVAQPTDSPTYPDIAVIKADELITDGGRLFETQEKTLRFVPIGEGYRVELKELAWDDDFGAALPIRASGGIATLHLDGWRFPLYGRFWDSLNVNSNGSVTFGWDEAAIPPYWEYADAGKRLLQMGPAIVPMFRKYTNGGLYWAAHTRDAVTLTFDVPELERDPWAFSAKAGRNFIQVRLDAAGVIEFRYKAMDLLDGVVGVFPHRRPLTPPRPLQFLEFPVQNELPPNLDITAARVEQVDDLNLSFTLQFRGSPKQGASQSVLYRIYLWSGPVGDGNLADVRSNDCWVTIGLQAERWHGATCAGPTSVEVSENRITILVPATAIRSSEVITWQADSQDFSGAGFDALPRTSFEAGRVIQANQPTDLLAFSNTESASGNPIYAVYHYPRLAADPTRITRQFYREHADTADFIVIYSEFRFDAVSAGASGFGAIGFIGGIGLPFAGKPSDWGSEGRLQGGMLPAWLFAPNQDDSGADSSGEWTGYERALALLEHEIGHRWGMNLRYAQGDQVKPLTDSNGHWLAGVHAPAAAPVLEEKESSPMGGGFWRDNEDHSFSAVQQRFGVLSGYGWLDLYAMGLIESAEIPDFFVLDDFSWSSSWPDGFPHATGLKTAVTGAQILDAMGKRSPGSTEAQKSFRTAFVLLVKDGRPTAAALSRIDAIRQKWQNFFGRATGFRAEMRTDLTRR